jgi:hypothetical protein
MEDFVSDESVLIHRVIHNRDNPYFMMNRGPVEDPRLSFKAVGILCYLLSKPDQWEVNTVDLERRHTDGHAAVRTGLKELLDAGYIKRRQIRDERGRILRWEMHIYETPQCDDGQNDMSNAKNKPDCPQVDNQHLDNQHLDNHPHSKYSSSSESIEERNCGGSPPPPREKSDLLGREKDQHKTNHRCSGALASVGSHFGATLDGAKESAPAQKPAALRCAEKLLHGLASRNVSLTTASPSKWAATILKFMENHRVAPEQFERVLDWYVGHLHEPFMPKANSAQTFVEKYDRINDAMRGELQAAGIDPDQTKPELYVDWRSTLPVMSYEEFKSQYGDLLS